MSSAKNTDNAAELTDGRNAANPNSKGFQEELADLSEQERKTLLAQMGNAREQKGKYIINEQDQTITLNKENMDPNSTLFIKKCSDCKIIVDGYCVKVLMEGCKNIDITFNAKIITAVVEIWKCAAVNVRANTKIGTLQLDMCKQVDVSYAWHTLFAQLIWAGTFNLSVNFDDLPQQKLSTGYDQMKDKVADLKELTDQFLVRILDDSEHAKALEAEKVNARVVDEIATAAAVADDADAAAADKPAGDGEAAAAVDPSKLRLVQELVVRLKNGFPTTEREARAYDERTAENVRKMAENLGITIKPAKRAGPKVGRNEPCHCGSGKKYKTCCMAKDSGPDKASIVSFALGAGLETLLEKSGYNAHIEMARVKKLNEAKYKEEMAEVEAQKGAQKR